MTVVKRVNPKSFHHKEKKTFFFFFFFYFVPLWDDGASQVAQWEKNLPAMQETLEIRVQLTSWEDPHEEGTETHSSILAWRIPWTEEPAGLQSIGCKQSDTTEATEHWTYEMIHIH